MTIWKHQKTKSSLHKLCNNHWGLLHLSKFLGLSEKKLLSSLESLMITLYNNPLCIFHKRPNLWWHYWQLTVASVLWFILIKAFIGPLFTVWRRAGWGFLRGRQDDFEKLKNNVATAGDLAIDHLNHVVSGLNTAGIYLLWWHDNQFEVNWPPEPTLV